MIMPAVETRATEAASSYQLALSTNSPTQTITPNQMMGFSTETSSVPSSLTKKKRGRPRKYGPDGAAVSGRTLSPMPLASGSSPHSGSYSDMKVGEAAGKFEAEKRKRRKRNSYEKSDLSLGKWPNGAASLGWYANMHFICLLHPNLDFFF